MHDPCRHGRWIGIRVDDHPRPSIVGQATGEQVAHALPELIIVRPEKQRPVPSRPQQSLLEHFNGYVQIDDRARQLHALHVVEEKRRAASGGQDHLIFREQGLKDVALHFAEGCLTLLLEERRDRPDAPLDLAVQVHKTDVHQCGQFTADAAFATAHEAGEKDPGWRHPANVSDRGPSVHLCARMTIAEVKDEATLKEWMRVPWRIYKDDRNWIPHLKQDIDKVFDPGRNKLLKEGAAQRWVLRADDASAIGRIAAFINPKTARTEKQPTGGMGFFECVNDQAAAGLLFDTARDWLATHGMEAMDGPVNLGERNMYWGLLIENFTDPPIYGANYNPPYYRELLERYGFQLYFKQLFFRMSAIDPVPPIFHRKYDQFASDPDITVRDVRGMGVERIAADFRTVLNSAWVDHENFKPMSAETALKAIRAMKPVMDPRIVVFVYHQDRPIAFFVNLPELNDDLPARERRPELDRAS